MRLFLKIEWPESREEKVSYDLPSSVISRFLDSPHVCSTDRGIYVRRMFGADNRVRDVQRYRFGQDGRIVPHCDEVADCGSHLVVLLESPHKDEYGNKGTAMNCPIAPAMGRTGNSMNTYLGNLLRAIEAPACEVIISNPIQFQASLYVVHNNKEISKCERRRLTDAVWKALWNVELVRGDFRTRILRYRPCLVVNACTSHLGGIIDEFLRSTLPQVCCWTTNHPSSWMGPKNRRVWHIGTDCSTTF